MTLSETELFRNQHICAVLIRDRGAKEEKVSR
jgi:hypothetical protein